SLNFSYVEFIRDLDNYRLPLKINLQNYEREIKLLKKKYPQEDLSFLEFFAEEKAHIFEEQIQADLDYFAKGSDLLEKALDAIRGRVEIEQAECDRNLQKTIQAVGFGIGAAGVVATSAPYWIDQNPEKINIDKPFTSTSLNTFTAVILFSFIAGLGAWGIASGWMYRKSFIAGVKGRLSGGIGNNKTQVSLPSSPGQPINTISQEPEAATNTTERKREDSARPHQ
ncbi:MAG TPA: hypothetical protein DCQ51_03175, partial [Planktothrix sp. UBA8407]|nr:hypothetical protein [Planktothrix sp. UBA8407]